MVQRCLCRVQSWDAVSGMGRAVVLETCQLANAGDGLWLDLRAVHAVHLAHTITLGAHITCQPHRLENGHWYAWEPHMCENVIAASASASPPQPIHHHHHHHHSQQQQQQQAPLGFTLLVLPQTPSPPPSPPSPLLMSPQHPQLFHQQQPQPQHFQPQPQPQPQHQYFQQPPTQVQAQPQYQPIPFQQPQPFQHPQPQPQPQQQHHPQQQPLLQQQPRQRLPIPPQPLWTLAVAAAAAAAAATPAPAVAAPAPEPLNRKRRLVLLDAANVAMSHGDCRTFSTRGIALALEFFERRGYEAKAILSSKFMPEEFQDADGQWRWRLHGAAREKTPDNPEQLLRWKHEGVVYDTPPGAYDDPFCIAYARERDALIVSNDRYRDIITSQKTPEKQEDYRRWIATHVCKFSFFCGDIVPDPSLLD